MKNIEKYLTYDDLLKESREINYLVERTLNVIQHVKTKTGKDPEEVDEICYQTLRENSDKENSEVIKIVLDNLTENDSIA